MKTKLVCPDDCAVILNSIPRRRLFETLARWCWLEVVLLVALPVGFVILAEGISQKQTPRFESSALIEIKAPGVALQAERPLPPDFLATQCELIKSAGNLQQVAASLDLAKRWNLEDRNALVKKLQRQLQVWVLPKTRLVRITAHSTDAKEARDLAQEIVKVYGQTRIGDEQRGKEPMLEQLKKAVRTQEDTVEECRKVWANITRARGIADAGQAGFPAMQPDPGHDALRLQRDTLEAQQATLKSQLAALDKNPFDQLLAYAKSATPPDETVAALYGNYQYAQQSLESLKATEPADEAATQFKEQRVAELRKDLENGVEILKITLRGELEIAKAKWAAVVELERAKKDDRIKAALDQTDLVDARQTFELESDQLQQMKRQLVEAETRANIAAEPILVREEPALATQPSSPNIHHNKKVAAVLGLLLALLAYLPMALLLEGCSANRRFKRALRAMRAKPAAPPAA